MVLLSSAISNVKADPFAQGQIPLYGDDIDISGSKFLGVSTYANLPYVHCLGGKDEDVETYDIAILGAPFDTVSRSLSCNVMAWQECKVLGHIADRTSEVVCYRKTRCEVWTCWYPEGFAEN